MTTEPLWETDPVVIEQRTTEAFMGALLNLALYGAALEQAGVTGSTPVTTQIPAPVVETPTEDPAATSQAQTGATQTAAQTTTPQSSTPTPATTTTTATTAAPAETTTPQMMTVPTEAVTIANRLYNRIDGDQNNTISFYEAERNIQRFARPDEGETSTLPTGAWGGTQGSTDDLRDALTTYMTRIASFDVDGDGKLEREELLAHMPFRTSTQA